MTVSSGILVRMFILITSRSSSNLGHVWLKTRSPGQFKEKLVNSIEVTFMTVSSGNLGRMLILIISSQVRIWVMCG